MSTREMVLTTLVLPRDLRARLEAERNKKGVSMAAIVRWALIAWFAAQDAKDKAQAEEQ